MRSQTSLHMSDDEPVQMAGQPKAEGGSCIPLDQQRLGTTAPEQTICAFDRMSQYLTH